MRLTAKDIIEYRKRSSELKTVGEFKALGREIRDRHGLTDRQAIDVMNGDNMLEILAQQEEGPPEWCPAKEKEWGPDHCVGKEPDCQKCQEGGGEDGRS